MLHQYRENPIDKEGSPSSFRFEGMNSQHLYPKTTKRLFPQWVMVICDHGDAAWDELNECSDLVNGNGQCSG